MKKLYSNKWVILSLVLPGLLLFFFAILAPICLSVYYGFTDYSGMGQAHFIGWQNYKKLIVDANFWMSMRNSLLLAIGFICIQHPLAMITAAVLDKLGGKGESFFRCVFFIPNVISVAVIAYLWKFIYNPDFGLLNNIIKAFGGKGGINWFSSDKAIWAVLVVLIWHGFGWGMLIYYTGIKNIDPVLYEAAAIDGASRWKRVWHITIPGLVPTIVLLTTLAMGNVLNAGFDQVFNMYNQLVIETGDIIDTYVYRIGITNMQFSLATAAGLFKSVVSFVLVVTSYVCAYKFADYKIF